MLKGVLVLMGRSAVEIHSAAALAVAHVVLESGGVAAAKGLLLDPWLLRCTEVVTAAPTVTALLTQLLLAEAIGTPLGRSWLHQGGSGGDGGRCSRKQGEEGSHGLDGSRPWGEHCLLVLSVQP